MICPKCEKQTNYVLSTTHIKKINSLERERKCKCGHEFITYELVPDQNVKISQLQIGSIVGKKARKIPKRTLWQDWRFGCYATRRMFNCFASVTSELEKKGLSTLKFFEESLEIVNIENVSGKIHYTLKDKQSGKNYKIKAEKKIDTIREILKDKYYWETRSNIFKNTSVKDMENRDKVRKEARQFMKSLTHKKTGIRAEKYNYNYFYNNLPETSFFFKKDEEKDRKMVWDFWSLVR